MIGYMRLRSVSARRGRRPCPTKAKAADGYRPNRACVVQSTDVFVDRNGIIYCTDYNAGLYTMQYDG